MTHIRPGWDEYFLLIAKAVSARGECVRSQVGAVIVRNRRIVSTGYNGVEAHQPSCLIGACPRGLSNLPSGSRYDGAIQCIAIHAEENAIMDAERRGLFIRDTVMYVSKEPCEQCVVLLAEHGIAAVWASEPVPFSPDEKRAFSKAWDERVERL